MEEIHALPNNNLAVEGVMGGGGGGGCCGGGGGGVVDVSGGGGGPSPYPSFGRCDRWLNGAPLSTGPCQSERE